MGIYHSKIGTHKNMSLKKNNGLLAALILIGLSLACGLGDQAEEANKLNHEANAIIDKNNEYVAKLNALALELLGENLTKVDDVEAYKKENKSKFDELVSISEQTEKLGAETIDKYEQAVKLDVSDVYKEYLAIKIQELQRRADDYKLTTLFYKEFLQTKDIEKINEQIEAFNAKSEQMNKEADELAKKAEQFEKDNPKFIKN
jgi:hypothetical protein